MINYDLITNETLRRLIIASESIQSLAEAEIQKMVERIGALPETGQQQIIASLEKEQEQISKVKLAMGITPEVEVAELEEKIQKVNLIKKTLENTVRHEQEQAADTESEKAAENVLKTL